MIRFDPLTNEYVVDGGVRISLEEVANMRGRSATDVAAYLRARAVDVQNEADAREARRLMGVE